MGCGASTDQAAGTTKPAGSQSKEAVLQSFAGAGYPGNKPSMLEPAKPSNTHFGGEPVNGTPVVVSEDMTAMHVRGTPIKEWPQRILTHASDHPWLVYRVLSFLPWSQKASSVLSVSKQLHKFFNPGDLRSEYWRWLCECLCVESLLYLPASQDDVKLLAGGDDRGESENYQRLFKDLWLMRHRFGSAVAENCSDRGLESESFRVSTFCRVRPPRPAALDGAQAFEMLNATPVQLPLNQRVALLQQKNPGMSRGQAMKALLNKDCGAAGPMEEGVDAGADGQQSEDTQAKKHDPSETQIPDAVAGPTAGFTASVVSVNAGPSGSLLTVSPGIGLRNWKFANVFDQNSKQRDVYERCGLSLAVGLVNGKSGALLCYGQTGSGKTHTMFGGPGSPDGLVTRIATDVLKAMESRRSLGFEVLLGASYVEVFGNDVTNLLGGEIGAHRGQAQRMAHKYVLEGKCEETVDDQKSFTNLLNRGEERKRKASTQMNERSTRAHTIVILRLRQRAPSQETFVESLLSLVDLGGSEKVTKSKANEDCRVPGGITVGDEVSRVTWAEYYKSRERITETNHINKGLLGLKRCVQALNKRQQMKTGGAQLRVPFKDTKLTQLLEPALSGHSSTSVVVCCTPEEQHAEETVQSLRFGEMCGTVEQEMAGPSDDANAAVQDALKRIDSEIEQLEAVILKKEKWEWRETVRTDVVDELDNAVVKVNEDEEMELGGKGAVEVQADDGTSKKHTTEHKVWGQVLVGAEEENKRREELIQMRLKLLGQD
eukprot:TRINITY_DN87253_c0_g1_i1.p1 TRINITY_DN87253_c0_g1~~TRINITY_DN87253_c0_g1_i1.p1  ORF type:complete len:771 (-),score=144.92 TRINITY_DN87253_c0_g1_i1:251-2563(-)